MKRDTVNYTLVGAFVVAMGVAFVVLLVAVTGRSGPTDAYYVEYDNVAGLKFGTGVFYEGYRVGQIETIEPQHGAHGVRYKVTLSIASGWRIPRDSIASVEASGLISAVSIQIAQGHAEEMLEPGSFIEGRGQADIFAVLNQAAGDFRVLSQDGVMPLLKNLNERVSQVADELVRFRRDELSPFVHMLHERVDKDLISEAQELLTDLDDSAKSLKDMVGESNQGRVRDFLTHIDEVAVNLNGLVGRIESTRLQMSGVLGSLGELVTDNSNELHGSVVTAERSMAELELALKTINQHLGTIMNDVEGSARNMNEFARVVRDNPSRLIRSSSGEEPGQ
ncbi:MAG: MCE family protein [Gammaproteobacteria bacterium]|nr:MCE family protein [Gammaproteobacteria bacterium]